MRRLILIVTGLIQSLIMYSLSNDLPDIEMVVVEGGTFTMGFDSDETEHTYETPKHEVTLHDFKIGKYEVTQALWEAVMGDNPSIFRGPDLPVENVSWNDVRHFIKKLNNLTGKRYRLPTEAEWEFAARGGNKSKDYVYIGGDEIDTGAWHLGNSDKYTHAVGSSVANELGIFDMAGNVSEWTQDWFGHYLDKAQKNPKGAKSSDIGKIFRGGHYANLLKYNKSACRFVSNPNFRSPTIGFRLAE